MPPQKTFATSVIAGGVAGSVAKTALAPLERARILLQVGRDDRGFVAAMRRVARDEGARGLWAGNAASVARVFPARGIAFASNDALRPLGAGHALGGFAAGGAAGLLATAATYPLDYARGVLGGATSRPGGVSRVLADAFREGGVAALYRGARPTLLGSIPFDGIRFGVVGALRGHSPPPRPGGDAVRRSAAFGAVGGLAAGVATFPNDTIRRVLQQPDNPYAGYVDCARRLLAAHGVARFYRGLGANLVRAAPSAAIQFATFEWLASALGSRV